MLVSALQLRFWRQRAHGGDLFSVALVRAERFRFGHFLSVVTGSFLAPHLATLARQATARWSPEVGPT